MEGQVHIRMLGGFSVLVNGASVEASLNRSKKGASLMRILILSDGTPVTNRQLLDALWDNERSSNPESALKTLVSRLRSQLNGLCEGLGGCIVADRGAYHWKNQPGVHVDLYDVEKVLEKIGEAKTDARKTLLCRKLMTLYGGKLLGGGANSWVQARATALHNQYLDAVCEYMRILYRQGEYERLADTARQAILSEEFDDRLHISLLAALLKLGRTGEAMIHYHRVKDLHFRYLGVPLSPELLNYYKKIVAAGSEGETKFSLDALRAELTEEKKTGAQMYEFAVFRDLYNTARNSRDEYSRCLWLGALWTGVQGRVPVTAEHQDDLMNSLIRILLKCLGTGDAVTRHSPSVLPVIFRAGSREEAQERMEHVCRLFQKEYHIAGLTLNYQIGPLKEEE